MPTNEEIADRHGYDILMPFEKVEEAYTRHSVIAMLAEARAEGFREGYKEGRKAAAEPIRRELGEILV